MAFERMANRYETQKDLIDRLHGTICRYKDVPVTVAFNKPMELFLSDIVTGAVVATIKPNDPDFDISSPEVGYFNYELGKAERGKTQVVFVTRMPYRRFRQGLYQQSCDFTGIDGGSLRASYGAPPFFATTGFRDSIMNVFPTVDEALRSPQDEIAVSREIAFKRTGSGLFLVYFKTKNIGWIKPGSHSVEIQADEFDWVIERYLNRMGLMIKEKIVGNAA